MTALRGVLRAGARAAREAIKFNPSVTVTLHPWRTPHFDRQATTIELGFVEVEIRFYT